MKLTNLLANKVAVIYGAGAVGGSTAKAFAEADATVFIADRSLEHAQLVASEITEAGGKAEAAEVDVLDAKAVQQHLDDVITKAGKVDISFNAMSIPQVGVQGIPLTELSLDSFTKPIHAYMTGHFITMTAAGRQMAQQHSGVILTITVAPAVTSGAALVGGMGPSWAGIESLTRDLAAELGPQNVRVITMRSSGMPDSQTLQTVVGEHAKTMGMTPDEVLGFMNQRAALRRLPNLTETANSAVFLASDFASSITGTAIDLTCGV